jgi:hypothetical protein
MMLVMMMMPTKQAAKPFNTSAHFYHIGHHQINAVNVFA